MIRADAQRLPLKNESIACIVTSPPYNVAAPYTVYDDAQPWSVYWKAASYALEEMYRVLQPGGRLWLNVQATVPYEPQARDRKRNTQGKEREARVNLLSGWAMQAEDVGFKYRDTVAWIQDAWDGQAAWGSWLRPTAPNLRGGWESILLVYKDRWKRACPPGLEDYRAPQFLEGEEYVGSWMELTRNVWHIRTARSKDHPAIFPPELVRRCVLLSTWPGELVLDPYAGSDTTKRVADALGRLGVGVDL